MNLVDFDNLDDSDDFNDYNEPKTVTRLTFKLFLTVLVWLPGLTPDILLITGYMVKANYLKFIFLVNWLHVTITLLPTASIQGP